MRSVFNCSTRVRFHGRGFLHSGRHVFANGVSHQGRFCSARCSNSTTCCRTASTPRSLFCRQRTDQAISISSPTTRLGTHTERDQNRRLKSTPKHPPTVFLNRSRTQRPSRRSPQSSLDAEDKWEPEDALGLRPSVYSEIPATANHRTKSHPQRRELAETPARTPAFPRRDPRIRQILWQVAPTAR